MDHHTQAFCLKQTLRQGAEFEVIPGIQSIDQEKDSVALTDSRGQVYRGRYLIGADGVHSQVRKITGEFKPTHTAFATEGIVPLEKCQSGSEFTFDYGVVQNGYGWLIPKHDHVNVGLYTCGDSRQICKAGLREYTEKNLGTGTVEHIVGFPIGIGGDAYVPRSSLVFLVGDATGFADPLLGEGIHNAIKSGQAAATALIAAIQSGADANLAYRAAIEDIRQDICNCRKISYLFYNQLSMSYALLKSRHFQSRLLKGFAQGMTMTEIRQAFFSRNFLSVSKTEH